MRILRTLLVLLAVCHLHTLCVAQTRESGSVYLSKQLLELQNDPTRNPLSLWLERGHALWAGQCQSCHGDVASLKSSAATFPRLNTNTKGKGLINLEDQIALCQKRTGNAQALSKPTAGTVEDDGILALSAVLHQAAKGQTISLTPPSAATEKVQWQQHLAQGELLYTSRMGRMNLACMHCHDQKVGAQMRADTISQGHPTGFPIYRMGWQTAGSVERRLRACYSGVQASVPPAGSADLRDLELFLKVRANGMPLDGPSIRR
jgi:L-cysteine S-thiosulfotransferase